MWRESIKKWFEEKLVGALAIATFFIVTSISRTAEVGSLLWVWLALCAVAFGYFIMALAEIPKSITRFLNEHPLKKEKPEKKEFVRNSERI